MRTPSADASPRCSRPVMVGSVVVPGVPQATARREPPAPLGPDDHHPSLMRTGGFILKRALLTAMTHRRRGHVLVTGSRHSAWVLLRRPPLRAHGSPPHLERRPAGRLLRRHLGRLRGPGEAWQSARRGLPRLERTSLVHRRAHGLGGPAPAAAHHSLAGCQTGAASRGLDPLDRRRSSRSRPASWDRTDDPAHCSLGPPAQRNPARDGTHLPGRLRDRHAAAHRCGAPLTQPRQRSRRPPSTARSPSVLAVDDYALVWTKFNPHPDSSHR